MARKLEKSTKADLYLIANVFQVDVPLNARKGNIELCMMVLLLEKGVIKLGQGLFGASNTSDEEQGAEAVTSSRNIIGQVKVEAEPPATTLGSTDLIALIPDSEDLKLTLRPSPATTGMPFSSSLDQFDVTRHIALIPQFRESEVDCYFCAFECNVAPVKWSKAVWS